MKKIFLIVATVVSSFILNAQQDAHYSFYMFNGLYLNPAYAGSHDVVNVMAIGRKQWTNIAGAPTSASVSIHSPLAKSNSAMGLIYTFDKLGSVQSNGFQLSYAYRLPLGKKKNTKLSFGLQAGVTNYQNRLADVGTNPGGVTGIDPTFANNKNLWLPNVGAGLYLYSKRYYVGFSVPHLLNMSLNKKVNYAGDKTDYARLYRHYLLTAGYVFNLGKKVKFRPSFLMKYVKNTPLDFDITAAFLFIDRIWLGASHRVGDSYDFFGDFYVTPQFHIGYAYDLTVSGLTKYAGGSHEVMLGYDFAYDKSRIVNPRYVKYF
jgi:type IX secretion system PorP/SprF family membrane protein